MCPGGKCDGDGSWVGWGVDWSPEKVQTAEEGRGGWVGGRVVGEPS